MDNRNILVVFSGSEGYGVRRGTLALSSSLQRAGFDTAYAALTAGPVYEELTAAGHRVELLTNCDLASQRENGSGRLRRFGQSVVQSYMVARSLLGLLRRRRPRLIYFRPAVLLAPVGMASRLAGVRAYWHMPNAISDRHPLRINKRLYWAILDRCPVVPMANSTYTRDTLDRGSDQIPVLHVGTDEGQFDPTNVDPMKRAELGIPSDAIVFGIAAKLKQRKGQLRFLQAMAALPFEKTRDVRIVLLGGPLEGPHAAEIRAVAEALGWGDRVILLGPVPDPERYYQEVIDVAVNARLDAEPYGQSVVEAMMMETPVLVHALGGPQQTVVDGVTGWHMPSASQSEFSAGILRVLQDRDKWQEMGQAARRRAVQNFSLTAQTKLFVELCELGS